MDEKIIWKFIYSKSKRIYSIRFFNSIISSFKSTENKDDVYRGKDCTKRFCESLREHARKIINLKKKKMNLFTKEQQESYENSKIK